MLSEDEDAPPVAAGLTINQKFAVKYDKVKRNAELDRAKELGLLSEDSESESEDEGELLTKKRDLEIHRVLEMIRAKDPRIYDKSTTLYENEDGTEPNSRSDDGRPAKATGTKPKVTVRSLAGHLLQRDGTLESDDEDEGVPARGADMSRKDKNRALEYNQEQRSLRKNILREVHGDGGAPEGGGDGSDSEDLFSARQHEGGDMDEAGISERLLEDEALASRFSDHDKERLRRFITAPAKDEADEFLRQFMVGRMWEDKDAGKLPTYRDVVGDSEDEEGRGGDGGSGGEEDEADLEDVERADDYERQFNFRFEEGEGGEGGEGGEDRQHLQSFPRGGVEGSVRRKKTKRREARKLRAERKAEERRRIEEELRRLKNLKRSEIESKLRDLEQVGGRGGSGGAGFGEEDLEGEWDPEAHDRRMAEVYGDDYYEAGEGDGPPPSEEQGVGGQQPGGDGDGDGDGDEGEWIGADDIQGTGAGAGGEAEAEAGAGSAEVAEAAEAAAAAQGQRDELLDELYALDHEDVVAGMPTRFKYRKVPANPYGLTTEQILSLEDKDLNQYVALKKMHPYQETEWLPDKVKRKWVRRRYRDVQEQQGKGAEKGKKAAERRREHRRKRKRAADGEEEGEGSNAAAAAAAAEAAVAAGGETSVGAAKGGATASGGLPVAGSDEEAPKKRRRGKRRGKGKAGGPAHPGGGEAGESQSGQEGNSQGGQDARRPKEKRRGGGKGGAASKEAKALAKRTGVAADRLGAYGLA